MRESARRGSNVNDVAVGILSDELGVPFTPTGRRRRVLAGSSPVLLLRVSPELRDEIQAEASRRDSNANDVILAALAEGLGVPARSNRKGKDLMAGTNGSKNGGRQKDKVRVRSSASATAPTPSSRASSTTRTRSRRTRSPA